MPSKYHVWTRQRGDICWKSRYQGEYLFIALWYLLGASVQRRYSITKLEIYK